MNKNTHFGKDITETTSTDILNLMSMFPNFYVIENTITVKKLLFKKKKSIYNLYKVDSKFGNSTLIYKTCEPKDIILIMRGVNHGYS